MNETGFFVLLFMWLVDSTIEERGRKPETISWSRLYATTRQEFNLQNIQTGDSFFEYILNNT